MVYARCLVNADRCKASAVSVLSVWAWESCFLADPCFSFLLSAHPLWTHVITVSGLSQKVFCFVFK